jgi:hypothetical protein
MVGGDVGQVELAAEDIDIHAAIGKALDALQAQAFTECRVNVSRQHQCAAFGRGEVLVGVEAEGDEVPVLPIALAVAMTHRRIARRLQ